MSAPHGNSNRTTHGLSRSRAYSIWNNMRNRCCNPNVPHWSRYGGRGITVCERWLTFANFVADMGEPPQGHQLDRIDNDGPYSPENCRWVTRSVNGRNKRNNAVITAFGETRLRREWSELSGIKETTISERLRRGWTPEKAVSHASH